MIIWGELIEQLAEGSTTFACVFSIRINLDKGTKHKVAFCQARVGKF